MAVDDPGLPLVFARPDAAAAGLSAGQVGRRAAHDRVRAHLRRTIAIAAHEGTFTGRVLLL